ncbi:MAG: phosphatidate cytidylyltransferase [Chloroflexi bacterium]|nr:phosphatidate cytidylyltransferase [Chloroflexota bacterium]
MTAGDWIGLGISYAYAVGLLASGEALHRFAGLPADLTRKLIHVGAGMWVFGILALFDRWEIGIVPFATFILVNYVLYRYRVVRAMDSADSSPGTVYFAIAITMLFALLWRPQGPIDRGVAATAGVMAMTWGDALAALVGKRFGRRKYTVGHSTRTLEGSAVMFATSALAMLLTVTLLPGSALAPFAPSGDLARGMTAALSGAAAATLVEAVSPHGTDNLSVPLAAAAAAYLAGA